MSSVTLSNTLQMPAAALAPKPTLPKLPKHIKKYSAQWLMWLAQNDPTPYGIAARNRRLDLAMEIAQEDIDDNN